MKRVVMSGIVLAVFAVAAMGGALACTIGIALGYLHRR